jgi:manganese/zinc/iron transport system permease protein
MLFAPNRGLVWRKVQERRSRRSLRSQHILLYLYWMAAQHEDITHPHAIDALRVAVSGERGVRDALERLERRGLVSQVDETRWSMTEEGIQHAREIERERYGLQVKGGVA